jgi:hypothetical protein
MDLSTLNSFVSSLSLITQPIDLIIYLTNHPNSSLSLSLKANQSTDSHITTTNHLLSQPARPLPSMTSKRSFTHVPVTSRSATLSPQAYYKLRSRFPLPHTASKSLFPRFSTFSSRSILAPIRRGFVVYPPKQLPLSIIVQVDAASERVR